MNADTWIMQQQINTKLKNVYQEEERQLYELNTNGRYAEISSLNDIDTDEDFEHFTDNIDWNGINEGRERLREMANPYRN